MFVDRHFSRLYFSYQEQQTDIKVAVQTGPVNTFVKLWSYLNSILYLFEERQKNCRDNIFVLFCAFWLFLCVSYIFSSESTKLRAYWFHTVYVKCNVDV